MTVAAITCLTPRISKVLLDTITDTGDNFSSVFALPHRVEMLVWQTIVVGAPSAISCKIWGAQNPPGFDDPDYEFDPADLNWQEMDASAEVAGEARNVTPINYRFIRVEQLSRTDGTSVSIEVTVR